MIKALFLLYIVHLGTLRSLFAIRLVSTMCLQFYPNLHGVLTSASRLFIAEENSYKGISHYEI